MFGSCTFEMPEIEIVYYTYIYYFLMFNNHIIYENLRLVIMFKKKFLRIGIAYSARMMMIATTMTILLLLLLKKISIWSPK